MIFVAILEPIDARVISLGLGGNERRGHVARAVKITPRHGVFEWRMRLDEVAVQ